MSNPTFSIVMCLYEVEEYLPAAIDSIKNQTFPDWELILVDDASPDSCGTLAERAAEGDDRIRVVRHAHNLGLSMARNSGIDAACGRYIWFPDADDAIDVDTLSLVYESLEQHPAQLVIFGSDERYYDKTGNYSHGNTILPDALQSDASDDFRTYALTLEQLTLYGYAWNKFYDLVYMKKLGVRFETMKLNEDLVFNVTYCNDIRRVNILPIAPYHYAKRMAGNLTNAYVAEYWDVSCRRIDALVQQQRAWGMLDDKAKALLGAFYARFLLATLQRNNDPRAGMTHADKKAWCAGVKHSELYRLLMPYATAMDSASLSLCISLLRSGSIGLWLSLGKVIDVVRNGAPMLYAKTKSER